MKNKFLTILTLALALTVQANAQGRNEKMPDTFITNPLLPGYYADPSLVQHDGKYYLYVTIDPWGNDYLACWVTDDFVNWEYNSLNWPTKQACATSLSNENKVWAPSVIKKDGKFYMYVSVGSEIWCGVADNPLGPWKNMLGNKPLVGFDTTKYCHIIDSEVFVDDDGKTYLYWGSGWEWINGRCFVAQLGDDMHSFKTTPKEVTPDNYFEAPFMIKRNSKYYLMYSDGKTIDATYKVRYATGDSPFGPFKEASNSPILQADTAINVFGPGHHTVANINGQAYILYHKHRLPYKEGTAMRQLCIDSLNFNANGEIEKITPTNGICNPLKKASHADRSDIVEISTSSAMGEFFTKEKMLDNSMQTIWYPTSSDNTPWVTVKTKPGKYRQLIVIPEFAWEKYNVTCETSEDGKSWKTVFENKKMQGSPWKIDLPAGKNSKQIRLKTDSPKFGIWELYLLK